MTTWPKRVRDGFRRLAEDVVALDGDTGNPFLEDDAPSLSGMAQSARRLLDATKERRRPVSHSRKEKQAKKESRRERMAEIREALVVIANGHCEACGWKTESAEGHAHHLISGGLRRRREEVGTMVWLCPACHSACHRNDSGLLTRILDLSRLTVSARAAVEHRLSKLASLRGAA